MIDYRFIVPTPDQAESGITDAASDPRIALLAKSVAGQQSAGFGSVIDAREFRCRDCGAVSFNGGQGLIFFSCGAEMHTDGEVCTPCPKAEGGAA